MLKRLLALGVAGAMAVVIGIGSFNVETTKAGTGDASQLVFTTQPGDGTATNPLSPQPVVQARDPGNLVDTAFTGTVTLTITTPAGAVLSGCTGGTAVAGVATFAACEINLVGSYTLTASSGALTTDESAGFNVNPLHVFTTQPSGCQPAVACTTQPVVTVQGDNGAADTDSDGDLVTLAVQSGPGTLACTNGLGAATVNGVAVFAGCTFSVAGTYVLTAGGPGGASGVSGALNVAAAAAATNTPTRTHTRTPTRTNTPVPAAATNTPVVPSTGGAAATNTPIGGAGAGGIRPPSTGTGDAQGTGTAPWLIAAGAALVALGGGAVAAGLRRKRA